MSFLKKKINNKKGQSLVEVVIAMAIFAVIAGAIMSVTLGSLNGLTQGGDETEANYLAKEAIEAIRSVRDGAWNELNVSPAQVSISGNSWVLSANSSELINNKYTRIITLTDICRNISGTITTCPANYIDPHTKLVTVTVTWSPRPGATNTVTQNTFITNWESRDWLQTDWIGGAGQAIWSDITKYFSDDNNLDTTTVGEIKLKNLGNSCGIKSWTFSTSTDYIYDSNKILVSTGTASLIDQGTGGSCSGTPNACSTFSTSPACSAQVGCSWVTGTSGSSTTWSTTWGTYADWESGGNASGASPTTGGNPTNYKSISISNNKAAQTSSGYWQQSFTTTVANPPTANINFDWRITAYNGTALTSYIIYVFVDNVAGAPTIGNQVWSQTITSTTGWATVSNLDVSSKLTTAGTYYIKLVARRIKTAGTGGTNTVGWDNVSLNWTGPDICSGTPNACSTFSTSPACSAQLSCAWNSVSAYPTDSPDIRPNNTYEVDSIDQWSSFSEIATKNGGEVYYQLSDNGGTNWRYWDGGAWVVAGASDYNTASVVNTNIGSFSTSSKQIMFKAFLASNGSEQVILDNVQVSCEKQYDWPFTNIPDYTFDTGKIEVTDGKAQLVDLGTGGSCSGTPNACSTFSTSPACSAQAGCAWTTGPTGATTNPSFDVNTTGWTYADWEDGVRAAGSRITTGGNPNGYINISLSRVNAASTASGYWQQPFNTTVANPALATVSFDWRIVNYNPTFLTSYIIYVFVDNVAGAPTIGNQVWSQTITSTTGWATVSNLDVSSKLTTAGTYYIKLVARRIKTIGNPPNTNNTVGWDNVSLNWTGPDICSGTPNACSTFSTSPACSAQLSCAWNSVSAYPTDSPSINPTTVYAGTNINTWTGFIETATKGTGEIYYQLSTDGSIWQYWNGGTWVVAGASDYNTASVVNTNISTFSTSTGQIVFKAFLTSNGSQQIQLDNTRVSWGEGAGGGYLLAGNFVSSAFNMLNISPVQVIEWDEIKPTNTDIKFQIRTAPDSGGVPGTWTSWYGAGGDSTYFTNNFGSIISSLLNNNQWVQYQAELTSDGNDTPVLQEVRINYK